MSHRGSALRSAHGVHGRARMRNKRPRKELVCGGAILGRCAWFNRQRTRERSRNSPHRWPEKHGAAWPPQATTSQRPSNPKERWPSSCTPHMRTPLRKQTRNASYDSCGERIELQRAKSVCKSQAGKMCARIDTWSPLGVAGLKPGAAHMMPPETSQSYHSVGVSLEWSLG